MNEDQREQPRRIGVCFNEYEPFYWEADRERTCPACSVDDETPHGFFVAEAELEQAQRQRDQYKRLYESANTRSEVGDLARYRAEKAP